MDRSHQLLVLWIILLCGIGQLLSVAFKCLAIGDSQEQLSTIDSKSIHTMCRVESRFAANQAQMTPAGLLSKITWIANVTYTLDDPSTSSRDSNMWYFPVVIDSTLPPSSMFECTIVKGEWPDRVVPGDLSYPLSTSGLAMMIVQGGLGFGVCMVAIIQMYLLRSHHVTDERVPPYYPAKI
jgi:hypothetical protein